LFLTEVIDYIIGIISFRITVSPLGTGEEGSLRIIYRLLSGVWIILGLSWLATMITQATEAYQRKMDKVDRKVSGKDKKKDEIKDGEDKKKSDVSNFTSNNDRK